MVAQLVGRRFPTEDGEAYIVGATVWSDAYVNVLVGDKVTARRVSDVLRFFESETPASPGRVSEARHPASPDREEAAMAATAEVTAEKPATAKKKSSGLASLSKSALRKKLLATPTIPDHAWAAYRQEHNLPEREKGETREAFIRRVLG